MSLNPIELNSTKQLQPCDQELKKLLISIQNLTIQMSNTFQQALLKHQQQFIKTYRIKITQLTKLFQDLTKVLQDKFINNALTNRLNIVLKQRDYFKYQCLKLNIQYQTVLNDQNGLNAQIVNIMDQMKIYKHLLEDEKIKNKELEKNAEKFKDGFNQMAYKTLTHSIENTCNKASMDRQLQQKKNKKLQMALKQLQEKNEQIRNYKIKISELEVIISQKQAKYFEKKQLYEVFKTCVDSWKRDLLTKQRKGSNSLILQKKTVWNAQKVTAANKKELLKYFFTSPGFLKFIQRLLFDLNFKVQLIQISPEEQKFMDQNRLKLYEYMRRKKVLYSPTLIQR